VYIIFLKWGKFFLGGGGGISRLCPYYDVILHSCNILGIQHPCFALRTNCLEKIVTCKVMKVKSVTSWEGDWDLTSSTLDSFLSCLLLLTLSLYHNFPICLGYRLEEPG